MPRVFWAKATRFSISDSSTKPLLSLSAWRTARPAFRPENQPPRRRMASRSSPRLIRPSLSVSNCFSQFLKSSTVISREDGMPLIAMAGVCKSFTRVIAHFELGGRECRLQGFFAHSGRHDICSLYFGISYDLV
uniref:Uncharacterized protein n=1 Tax=Oryza glumipatula TaxID=40148 RepID=A0A0E0AMR7_9ORYZ